MSNNTVTHFAAELSIPAQFLLEQLRIAGVELASVDDEVTDSHKSKLPDSLRRAYGSSDGKKEIVLTRRQSPEAGQDNNSGRQRTIQVEVRKKRMFVKRDPTELLSEARRNVQVSTELLGEGQQTQDVDAAADFEFSGISERKESYMKSYESLFKWYKGQSLDRAFCYVPARNDDYDRSFKDIALKTSDGYDAWEFKQEEFKNTHKDKGDVPKLKNYLKESLQNPL